MSIIYQPQSFNTLINILFVTIGIIFPKTNIFIKFNNGMWKHAIIFIGQFVLMLFYYYSINIYASILYFLLSK